MGSEVLGDDVACFEVELLDYGKKIIIPVILVNIEIIIQHNYSIALEKSWIFFFGNFYKNLTVDIPQLLT